MNSHHEVNEENTMLSTIFFNYKNLILQILFSLTITLILTILHLPIRFLEGLNTYIHPENIANDKSQSGFRPAIRRPNNNSDSTPQGYQNLSSSSSINEQPRKKKSKEKFEFDENNAQIFRLQLVDSHLVSRLYYSDYQDVFTYSFVGISSIILQQFLSPEKSSGVLVNGSLVPVFLGFFALLKVFVVIGKLSFERSASKRTEKQLSVIFGGLGFLLGFSILHVKAPSIIDFNFESIDGFEKFTISSLAGCLAGFLFMPATKIARSFWIGTDQLRWNLSIISCGWFARLLLYVNLIIGIFTSLLWIKPFASILVNINNVDTGGVNSSARNGYRDSLIGNVGVLQSDFDKFRVYCLLAFGLSQFLTLRMNLQMYLNEAVLCWYQRLHASKVPDLDFSRAKIFLHNYFMCLVVLQFFAPSALVLLLLGLSQIGEGNLLMNFPSLCNFIPCSLFVKEVAMFLAWWVVFICAIFSSSSLVLYRSGFLYVS